VLGPLPPIYRLIVSACALGACVGLGAWLTWTLPGPLLAPAGAGIGAGIGMVATLLLLHDFHRRNQRAKHVHVRTHRHR
jgi:hypothetical protein